MSVARTVSLQYDLTALEQAARELGFIVSKQVGARGWYGVMKGAEKCELVITSKAHRFDMGFVKQGDGSVKMFADYHGGHVQQEMAEMIIPRYLEIKSGTRMRKTGQVNGQKHVTLTLERR
jgi:hypothetical protein